MVKLYDLCFFDKGPFATFKMKYDWTCEWTGLKFSNDDKLILISTNGSFIRLKNAEIAYTFTGQPWLRKVGLESLRLSVSGNNLWLWTRMPDDRESNLGGFSGGGGAYPTVRRINFGIKLGF